MAEQGKKSEEQIKKRPRFSDNAEGSGAKKTSIAAVARDPVSTISPAELAAANYPVAARTYTRAAPSPVAKTKPTTPLALMPPAQPTKTVAMTSPVAATPQALAAPCPADTRVLASTKTPTPGPVSTAKPVAEVKTGEEDAVVAEEDELVTLELPKKLFHCAACHAPLKPPIFMCQDQHFVCCACAGDEYDSDERHLCPCGDDLKYHVQCEFMDGVVGGYKVPCPYKKHGCPSSTIVYHAAASHKARCAHAPTYCLECTPSFEGSPENLLHHLTGKHSWPTDKIRYEESKAFVVRASSEDHRRLLVAEDGAVFLLAVGAGWAPAGRRPVNVVCVRGNTDADARPVYTGVLWVDGPPAQLRSTLRLQAILASCSVPGELDMEQGCLHAHVNPKLQHGDDSGEVHLRLRITKFP